MSAPSPSILFLGVKQGQASPPLPLQSEKSGLRLVAAPLPAFHLGHASLVPTEIRRDVVLELAIGEPIPDLLVDFCAIWRARFAHGSFIFHGISFRDDDRLDGAPLL